MACEENPFALLGDDEGDYFSTLLAYAAMKTDASSAAAEKQQEQKEGNSWHSKLPSGRLPPADYVRAANGRGTGGRGRGSGRSSFNDIQQFGNGYSNGHQRYNRGSNGHRQNNGGADGYRRDGGRADGYRRNGGGFDGYHGSYGTRGKDDGNRQALRCRREGAEGRSDSGQGGELNEDNGFETVSQSSELNQQLNTPEQGVNTDGGWGTVTGGHSFKNKQQPRNWNSSFGGERRTNGYGGGFRARGGRSFGASDRRKYESGAYYRRNYRSGEVMTDSAAKEAGLGGDQDVNGNYGTGNVDVAEVLESPSQDHSREEAAQDEKTKEAIRNAEEEASRKAQEREQKQKEWEARRKAQEEEAKEMTLKQYEKLLLEKRKALESLKTEERKVTLDRDFESMQPGGKKKEDNLFIKQETEKGKLKNKDEKNRKVSIKEFLKPAVAGQGQGLGGYRRGSLSRQAAGDPANGNFGRNELLKRNVGQDHVENSDRHGGGGRNRGSRGADSTNRDDDERHNKEILKPVLAIGDPSQFPDLGGVALKSS